ncbi:inositol phospholipid synthesis and fat-storage-inducing TM-domain-containing protein [Lipomyces orientalis]|uniref:Inositol phospholipid synthesis and fat-storage-inducing TM-domain-containing protein n=1 Tax=Lipomyces orientalis TaxID=1233043 RepID=A0ACC3TGU5_9ASCO
MEQGPSSIISEELAGQSTVPHSQPMGTDNTRSSQEHTGAEETSVTTPVDSNGPLENRVGSPLLSAQMEPPTPPLTPPPAYPRTYLAGLFTFEQLSIYLIYPTTIAFGSLISVISPPESYFGLRTNFFNIMFVKKGWLWTTIAFMVHCIRLRISKPSKLAIRYVIAASWWFLFTQWFFGAPIMDRVFIGTGGVCLVKDHDAVAGQEGQVHDIWSSFGCRHVKGEWVGGHDISGHSFLLTHASLFLWFELLPVIMERGPMLRQIHTKVGDLNLRIGNRSSQCYI